MKRFKTLAKSSACKSQVICSAVYKSVFENNIISNETRQQKLKMMCDHCRLKRCFEVGMKTAQFQKASDFFKMLEDFELTCELCGTWSMSDYSSYSLGKHAVTRTNEKMDLCGSCFNFVKETKKYMKSREYRRIRKSPLHDIGIDCEVSAKWKPCSSCRYKKFATIAYKRTGGKSRQFENYINGVMYNRNLKKFEEYKKL